MSEEPIGHEGISRRRMLKRVGAGAAIAWSAPILSSLRTPAFAQYPVRCTECAGDFCFGQTICGDSGPFGCNCAQVVEAETTCFCYEDDFCSNRDTCTEQSDCPAGQTCVHTCCDAALGTPVCFSPCGAGAGSASGSGARGSRPA
jgi:hypothetical protein